MGKPWINADLLATIAELADRRVISDASRRAA
jgi:hypothetical protein